VLSSYGLAVAGTLAETKKRLNNHLTTVQEIYKEEGLETNVINFWDMSAQQPTFSAICTIDKGLLYAACSSIKSIVSVAMVYDGVGIKGALQPLCSFNDTWKGFTSICAVAGSLYVASKFGMDKVCMNSWEITNVLSSERDEVWPYKIKRRQQCVLFTDPTNRMIYSYDTESMRLIVFAGNGKETSVDGPNLEASFRQPCGIDVEFENVVYVTDIMTHSIILITPLSETIRFLRSIGCLYKAFSVDKKGESYDRCNLKGAIEYVNTCLETLQLNKRAISADVTCRKLPKTLNGPEGNVANKTIGSVQMILLELKHLQEILETRCYTQYSLKSCMTLDVEHFHSTTHVKNTTMSMLQYCRSFGDCIKKSIKRLTTWSAHYFTSPKSWYPLPQGSLKLEDVPLRDPLHVAVSQKMSSVL